jgi:hypothetical protein
MTDPISDWEWQSCGNGRASMIVEGEFLDLVDVLREFAYLYFADACNFKGTLVDVDDEVYVLWMSVNEDCVP